MTPEQMGLQPVKTETTFWFMTVFTQQPGRLWKQFHPFEIITECVCYKNKIFARKSRDPFCRKHVL